MKFHNIKGPRRKLGVGLTPPLGLCPSGVLAIISPRTPQFSVLLGIWLQEALFFKFEPRWDFAELLDPCP
jgi:hypothetical protein